ncbi:hypothetical protein SK128_024972 [Halocaridina rubra]|uniref:Uncharacterized protein n=1 Tax=Halocaridina rubra TaxID=373956 RepID=A0AAN9A8D5_HALRR
MKEEFNVTSQGQMTPEVTPEESIHRARQLGDRPCCGQNYDLYRSFPLGGRGTVRCSKSNL